MGAAVGAYRLHADVKPDLAKAVRMDHKNGAFTIIICCPGCTGYGQNVLHLTLASAKAPEERQRSRPVESQPG